jgi:hypothetical protein
LQGIGVLEENGLGSIKKDGLKINGLAKGNIGTRGPRGFTTGV